MNNNYIIRANESNVRFFKGYSEVFKYNKVADLYEYHCEEIQLSGFLANCGMKEYNEHIYRKNDKSCKHPYGKIEIIKY
jgi:hypothetical protein